MKTQIDFFDNRFLMFVIDEMAYEYEKEYDDVIRLTLGKSELPVCDAILCAMKNAITDFSKSALVFPAGLPQLREKIAQHYKERYEVEINPKNVIVSTGTSTIFRNLYHLLAEEGDEVLLPLPYYSLYKFCGLLVRARIRYYEIDKETLSLDLDSFEENFTEKTKLVVINSPGNPLGNIVTRDELLAIDSIVDGRAYVISDEIYDNTCFDDEHCTSVGELYNTKSIFIVTNSFSKAYRMYSRRVGYCIVPDELVEPMTVTQHHTLLTADPVPQFGAIEALDHPEEVDYLVDLYRSRRDYTVRKFECVPDVMAIPAKGSFYLTLDSTAFIEKSEISNCLELAQIIMERTHVATVPGSDFGLPGTLRLSYSSAKYEEGIDRLVDFFVNYSNWYQAVSTWSADGLARAKVKVRVTE